MTEYEVDDVMAVDETHNESVVNGIADEELTDNDAPYDIDEDYQEPSTAEKRPPTDSKKRAYDEAFASVPRPISAAPTSPTKQPVTSTPPASSSSSLSPPPSTISPPTYAPGRGKSVATVEELKRENNRRLARAKKRGLSLEEMYEIDFDEVEEEQPRPAKRVRHSKKKTTPKKAIVVPRKSKKVVNIDDDQDVSDFEEPKSDDEDESWAPTKKEKTRLTKTKSKGTSAKSKSAKTPKVATIPSSIVTTLPQRKPLPKLSEVASSAVSSRRKLTLEEVCEKEAREARAHKPMNLEDDMDSESDSSSVFSLRQIQAPTIQRASEVHGRDGTGAQSIFNRDTDPMLFSQEAAMSSMDMIYDYFPHFGGSLVETRLPSLRKLARRIPPQFIPPGRQAWMGFCATNGIFDVIPETAEMYGKERERRLRVVKALVTKGYIENPGFFDVYSPEIVADP
jgi:hypothetical protein